MDISVIKLLPTWYQTEMNIAELNFQTLHEYVFKLHAMLHKLGLDFTP
jgi:hypothetical protein